MSRGRGRRGARVLDPIGKQRVLDAMGDCRREINLAMASLPIRGPEYMAAAAVTDTIDGLAELLTGSRQHFWLKSHSAPGYSGNGR